MKVSLIKTEGLKDLSKELLLPNGKLKLLKASEYQRFDWDSLRAFCHFMGRYGLPTVETVDYLKSIIGNRSAIEIGSGHGDIGYHLGIPMTDSKVQQTPLVKQAYQLAMQPVIEYPKDVERLDALDAVKKYKPQVVIGSWVTTFAPVEQSYGSSPYGIKEDKILDLVETYIVVGTIASHGDKPIMALPHEEIYKDFILSRSNPQSDNRIFIWNTNRTQGKNDE